MASVDPAGVRGQQLSLVRLTGMLSTPARGCLPQVCGGVCTAVNRGVFTCVRILMQTYPRLPDLRLSDHGHSPFTHVTTPVYPRTHPATAAPTAPFSRAPRLHASGLPWITQVPEETHPPHHHIPFVAPLPSFLDLQPPNRRMSGIQFRGRRTRTISQVRAPYHT